MASATLRRSLWIAGALGALGALAAVAFHGERPEAGLDRYQPAGLAVTVPPDRVTAVIVEGGGRRRRLLRTLDGWADADGDGSATEDLAAKVELALRTLHGSSPQRVLSGAEAATLRPSDVGLSPPSLRVRLLVGDTEALQVDLGGTNPQGFSSYARVAGRDDVYLVARYLARAWQEVLK